MVSVDAQILTWCYNNSGQEMAIVPCENAQGFLYKHVIAALDSYVLYDCVF